MNILFLTGEQNPGVPYVLLYEEEWNEEATPVEHLEAVAWFATEKDVLTGQGALDRVLAAVPSNFDLTARDWWVIAVDHVS